MRLYVVTSEVDWQEIKKRTSPLYLVAHSPVTKNNVTHQKSVTMDNFTLPISSQVIRHVTLYEFREKGVISFYQLM